MKLITKAATTFGTAAVAIAALGGIAGAATAVPLAQSNSISGSSTPAWYTSTNMRHVTTANDTIKVGLHSFPAGLQWELQNANPPEQIFAGPVTINTTDWEVVATQVLSGTIFYNVYRSSTSGNFNGNEYY